MDGTRWQFIDSFWAEIRRHIPRRQQVAHPTIDAHLTDLSAFGRVAEVLRHQLLQVEFAISPGGLLRVWLSMMLLVAIVLAIPTWLLAPVIYALVGSVAGITQMALLASTNLLQAVITIVKAVSIALGFAFGLNLMWRAYLASNRRGQYRRR